MAEKNNVGSYSNYRSFSEAGEQSLIPASTNPVTGWKEDVIQALKNHNKLVFRK